MNTNSRPGQALFELFISCGLGRATLVRLINYAFDHFSATAPVRTFGMSAVIETNTTNNQNNSNPDTNNTTAGWRHMRRDPNRVDNIGRDELLRSLNADHTVVLDYRRLSPEEIKEFIAPIDQATKDALLGVDGRDVTDEAQLWAVPIVYLAARESKSDINDTTGKRPWRRDREGVTHLSRDGVLRSLNADRTAVLDVRRFSPEEIKEFCEAIWSGYHGCPCWCRWPRCH